ncbi:hypothetical protein CFOL_v3_16916, partial [Cephalotus follicularis]
ISLILLKFSGCSVPSDETQGFRYFLRVSKKTFDYVCSLVREDLVLRPPSGLINIEERLSYVATHIITTLLAVQTSDDWSEQENNYSMFLQGVVDHDMRFLDIVTSWP